MKKSTFLFCLLLAFSSCGGDSSGTQEEKESKLEEIAADLHTDANEAGAPEVTESPETEALPMDPEETLPGATSGASAAATMANPLFNYTLQKGQAGAVKIGMTINELRKQYGQNKLREVELIKEGITSRAYEVLGERSRTDLRVEQDCAGDACTVSRITVLNPAFKSQEGIGIGSTFGDLKKSFTISRVTPGEEHFLAISANSKMSFFLDLGNIPAERWSKLKITDVPNDATVTGILLY